MTFKLFLGAMLKFLLGVALVGASIFLSAGTHLFFNGWLLMGIFFMPRCLERTHIIIAKRIKIEEEFLEKELLGYSEYKQKVKYRLILFVW